MSIHDLIFFPSDRKGNSRLRLPSQICYDKKNADPTDGPQKEQGNKMNVNESAENYLETILILSKVKPVVRSVDIAEELGFKKSSVSVAMKNLREKNHITVTKEGFIYLTDSGKEIADMIYERHQLLSSWLTRLGVDPVIATQDACRIEHVISRESFEAIKKHIK